MRINTKQAHNSQPITSRSILRFKALLSFPATYLYRYLKKPIYVLLIAFLLLGFNYSTLTTRIAILKTAVLLDSSTMIARTGGK